MENTENTTAPAGYSREALREALRELSVSRHDCLLLDPKGWVSYPRSLLTPEDGLSILDYEGLLAAIPNCHPEDFTEIDIDEIAISIADEIAIDCISYAIGDERDNVEREEAYQAQIEQRPIDPNATSERLETLRTILATLKRA